MRAALSRATWPDGEPSEQPALVEENVLYDYASLDGCNCREMRRLHIALDLGSEGKADLCLTREPPIGELLVICCGHEQNGATPTIAFLAALALAHGIDALIVPLPLMSPNPNVIVDGHDLTANDLHEGFALMDSNAELRPLQWWLTPLRVALNYVDAHLRPRRRHIASLSGGAVPLLLAGALWRFDLLFSVFGWLPLYLRLTTSERGDREQREDWAPWQTLIEQRPDIDPYVLAAYLCCAWPGSEHDQTVGPNEPDFPSAIRETQIDAYARQIVAMGGAFTVTRDPDVTHEISEATARRIVARIVATAA